MPTATITEEDGKAIGSVFLAPKVFSTGSKGYHASRKVQLSDGATYQLNFMLVRIGSKNES